MEEKVHPQSLACNKALRDLPLPAECTITAIIRKSQLIIPRGDTVFQPADEVLALVHQSRLYEFAALLAPPAPIQRN
ncbi:MAG: TrkA C-terminal domain-containing protein [Anaerolineales bacterium]